MEFFKSTLIVLAVIIVTLITIVLLTTGGMFLKKHLGVWNANIDRGIYQESQSYNEGKEYERRKLEREKRRSDKEGRGAIENLQHQLAPVRD